MAFYNDACTFDQINDTRAFQLTRLIEFAQALGYEPVFNSQGQLQRFKSERMRAVGQEIVSVNNMIEKHNKLPSKALREIQDGKKCAFQELMQKRGSEDMILALFAGSLKVIKQIKATHSRHSGFVVQSHKLEFMTKRDEAQYGHLVK